MFRFVASVIVVICVFGAWFITSGSDTIDPQSAGNASPNTEQAPANPQEAKPKKPNFDTR